MANIIGENDESDSDYIARWHVQLLRKSTKVADTFLKPHNIEDFDDMDDADIVSILPDATVRHGHYSFGCVRMFGCMCIGLCLYYNWPVLRGKMHYT